MTLDPERSNELHLQAEAASDIRRYEAAQSLAARAVALDPSAANGYGSLARACLGLEQFEDAELHCHNGLQCDPENDWLLQILVIVTRLQNKLDESIRLGKNLVQGDPENSRNHELLGRSLMEARAYKEAITHFELALQLDPQAADASSGIGYCELSLGKPEVAERHYRYSLSLQPGDALALNNLGVSLEQQGKKKDASLAFKAAVISDPTFDLAKSNAKSSISGYLSLGGGWLAVYLVYIGMRVIAGVNRSNGMLESKIPPVLIIAFAWLVLLSFASFYFGRRLLRKRSLKNADPQILDFYNAVRKDSNVK